MDRQNIADRPVANTYEQTLNGHTANICAIVCTRDRPDLLSRALHSLLSQLVPLKEIIVVDNDPSTDASMRIVQQEYPSIRYIREHIRGLNFARNRALSATESEIAAFIDDDVVASPDWGVNIANAFRLHDRAAICTGKVDALALGTVGQMLFEANRGFSHGDKTIRLPLAAAGRGIKNLKKPLIAWSISAGVGCNFAIRRTLALELGGFDNALDFGSILPGGGDHDMIWRALQAGYEVVYEPTIYVRHDHRRDVEAAINQILGHNRATVAMVTKAALTSKGKQKFVVLAYLLWRLWKPGLRLIRRTIGKDPLPYGALFRLWWHCLLGVPAYPVARHLAKQSTRCAPNE